MAKKKNILPGVVAGLLGGVLQGVNAYQDRKIEQKRRDQESQRTLDRQKEYSDYVDQREQHQKELEAKDKAREQAKQTSSVGSLLSGYEDVANTSGVMGNPLSGMIFPTFDKIERKPLSEQRTSDLLMSLDDDSLQRYNTIKKEREPKKEDLYQFDKKLYRYKPDGTIDIDNPIMESAPDEQETSSSYFTDADKVPGLGEQFAGQKVEVTERYKGGKRVGLNYGNPIKIESDYGDYNKIKVLSPEAKKIVNKIKEERILDNGELEVARKRGDVFKPVTKQVRNVDDDGVVTYTDQIFYTKKTFQELRDLRNTKRRKNIEVLKSFIPQKDKTYYDEAYNKYKQNWDKRGNDQDFSAFEEIKKNVNEAYTKGKMSAAVYELYNNLMDEEFGLTLDLE